MPTEHYHCLTMETSTPIEKNRSSQVKSIAFWFLVCNGALILSTFIHECAHGFSSWLAGYSVSTGFNRVGNAYRYPGDDGFRADWTDWIGGEALTDMGPAVTLLLAVIFTAIFLRKEYRNSVLDKSILAMALGNAMIRLVPCVIVALRMAIASGGMEDEIQQGEALAQHFGVPLLSYLPIVVSIVVSLGCLCLIYRKLRSIRGTDRSSVNPLWAWLAYASSLGILNVLDNFVRINWVV
jgi:hypothetical protein